mmetsp:Transcript_61684/g.135130  ORF Transcript_61684/g.135130 Transcript_61684/m.135130 type:complete len:207 (+) Transcript_61684:358-978(+)
MAHQQYALSDFSLQYLPYGSQDTLDHVLWTLTTLSSNSLLETSLAPRLRKRNHIRTNICNARTFQVAIFHFVQFLHPDAPCRRKALRHQLRRAHGPALLRGADDSEAVDRTEQLLSQFLCLFFSLSVELRLVVPATQKTLLICIRFTMTSQEQTRKARLKRRQGLQGLFQRSAGDNLGCKDSWRLLHFPRCQKRVFLEGRKFRDTQ